MAPRVDRRPGTAPRQQGNIGKDEGLQLSFIQVLASALAAVSGAIVTSAFGVAGTITGAAVMSVIATSATAIYSHSIKRTGRMLRQPLHPGARHPSSGAAGYARAPGYGGAAGYGGAPGYGGGAGEGGYSGTADPGYGAPVGGGYGAPAGGGYGAPTGGVHGAPTGGASGQPATGDARPGYTAPRTYGKGRRLDRRVGLALGIVLTFVIAVATLTIIELATGQSSAGLWGQGGNAPSIIGGGDAPQSSPKSTSPTSTPSYSETPTPARSPTSTATSSASSSPSATPTPSKTTSPTATSSSPQLRAPSTAPRVATPTATP